MTANEEVIVLNHTKIRENMIVLHTLGRNCGRRSFLIRTGAKTRMSYFLPLNVLELSVTENRKSDLLYAKVISAKYPLSGIRANMYKNTISLFMAEVLYRTVKEGSQEDGLFEWCEKQTLTLDALKTDFSNYHIRFMLELCIALGFRPEPRDMEPFSGENQALVVRFMQSDFAESMLIPLNGQTRNDIAAGIIRYLEYHTESAINIRSLSVLRELFTGM